MTGTYFTISASSEGIYKEKGSKFICFAFPIQTEDDIKKHINTLKIKHPNARHFCYAFVLQTDYSHYRGSDDGEPNGTAGAPILGQLKSKKLTNTLVVVVRYFGGTKLGVSGLITAYKTAAQEALDTAIIIKKTIDNYYSIRFTYEQTGEIMRILGDKMIKINDQTFEENCLVLFSVRKTECNRIIVQLKKTQHLKLLYLKTE